MDIIIHTPYVNLSSIGRPDVFLKLECDQFGNSFKSRGITGFLKDLPHVTGLVTYTTGNHGIALAAIAEKIGVPAIIVSSDKLSEYKKNIVEGYGAEVILTSTYNVDKATAFAKELADSKGYTFVPLYDNDDLLEGYSGISREILKDFDGDFSVFFPIGSGSLLLANSRVIKDADTLHRVYGVEPHLFQRLGDTVQHETPSRSIADSLSIDRIPHSNLELLQYVDGIIAIDEEGIIDATRLIYDTFGHITEPSGAITLAAALDMPADDRVKIAVVTGKNISHQHFDELILRSEQKTIR